MTTPTSLEVTGSSEFSIPEIVKLARDGSIRIPSFQRSFVWDSSDVRRLFDSIYRGFPIGTMLLWRKEAPAGTASFGPISFRVPHRTDALWVVDGQQRITSLFGALNPDHLGQDERFQVYFDLAAQKFINPRRGMAPPRAIPIREALETRRLSMWTRTHDEDLELNDFDLADGLVGVIRDYRIAAYIVAEDDELVLREVFDRVNSAGKPMTRAQVFHALFANDTEPGSPAAVVKELSRLGFGILDEIRIVQSLLALRGGDVQRDLHDEFSGDDDAADWYDRTEEALTRAIQFLRTEGVGHILLVPYTPPLSVLAAFFYLHPEPNPWVLRLLARWLWRGWINGEGGAVANLRKSVRAVNPRKLHPKSAPNEYDAAKNLLDYVSDRPAPTISLEHFQTDKAQGRIILLALASLCPRRPDGTGVDLSNEFEKFGSGAITELVRGHRSNAAARGFWPSDVPGITGTEDPKILASHAIDPIAADLFRHGNIAGFLDRRAGLLTDLVSEFMTNHLESNALVRPPLEYLIVPDESPDAQ